jgi:prepilin-type N-terminal cleavage/methylation domain-containing protein
LYTRIKRLVRQLQKSGQRGFTLIEMLVVISILGMLAAVVTISMIGITTKAQASANSSELKTVQVALDSMLTGPSAPADASTAGCKDDGSNQGTNMAAWPSAGFALNPTYIHETQTHIRVWCDSKGAVHSPDVAGS